LKDEIGTLFPKFKQSLTVTYGKTADVQIAEWYINLQIHEIWNKKQWSCPSLTSYDFLDVQPGKEREQGELSTASASGMTSSWPPHVEAANHTLDPKERSLAQDNQVIRSKKDLTS